MRRLASDSPFARYDSKLFYKQAKFMEDFADDYEASAPFSMYYPFYQHMGYEQLRTYFSWRTSVRNGASPPTSLSYVFLYIYELLCGIGVDGPADGLNRLMAIWQGYRENDAALDRYLPQWLKDYHIYYDLPRSFEGFVSDHGLHGFYPAQFLYDRSITNRLSLWNAVSSYDIDKSKFYDGDNKALMSDCFDSVVHGILDFCADNRIRIEDLLSFGYHSSYHWYPFNRALFYDWLDQPDRLVSMPGQETYQCKNNRWYANVVILDTGRKETIGYLIKKTEECLRKAVKYKYKITANPGMLAIDFRRTGISIDQFNKAIEKAVVDFHRGLTRTVVTVDSMNLARIRREALGTQARLIVPQDAVAAAIGATAGDETGSGATPGAGDAWGADATPDVGDAWGADATPGAGDAMPIQEPGGWEAFSEALSTVERKALSVIFHGDAGIKTLADENSVMLEVLIDSINEKATDHIGDNIVEMNDGIVIYGEYRDIVMKSIMI
jgi:hypothetical protein